MLGRLSEVSLDSDWMEGGGEDGATMERKPRSTRRGKGGGDGEWARIGRGRESRVMVRVDGWLVRGCA